MKRPRQLDRFLLRFGLSQLSSAAPNLGWACPLHPSYQIIRARSKKHPCTAFSLGRLFWRGRMKEGPAPKVARRRRPALALTKFLWKFEAAVL